MARPSFSRYRQIAGSRFGIFPFAVVFITIDGVCRYLESLNPGILGRFRLWPPTLLLFVAGLLYGLRRVIELHPIWNSGYRTWLESTPWTSRKPLPIGPVELVWEDGLFLGPLLLLSATQPVPYTLQLICMFLLSYLLTLMFTFWLTRIRFIGFATAFGVGLAVRLWRQPNFCLAALIVFYVIAHEGLRQGLRRFPWKPRKMFRRQFPEYGVDAEACGWPYDRTMRDVHGDPLIAPVDFALCCMVAIWWIYALSSLPANPMDGMVILLIFGSLTMCLVPILRWFLYAVGYSSPISLWGRIWTGRWIIPGYDQILIAPLCAILCSVLVFFVCNEWRIPLEYSLPVAMATTTTVAVLAPPRLRRWRLTGNHRLVPLTRNTRNQHKNLFKSINYENACR